MPPGATQLLVTFTPVGKCTQVELTHSGLQSTEAKKLAIGWSHFLDQLGVVGAGGDPGPDPRKESPPAPPRAGAGGADPSAWEVRVIAARFVTRRKICPAPKTGERYSQHGTSPASLDILRAAEVEGVC